MTSASAGYVRASSESLISPFAAGAVSSIVTLSAARLRELVAQGEAVGLAQRDGPGEEVHGRLRTGLRSRRTVQASSLSDASVTAYDASRSARLRARGTGAFASPFPSVRTRLELLRAGVYTSTLSLSAQIVFATGFSA